MGQFNEWVINLFKDKTQEEEVDPILDSMEENGYSYDPDNEWWVRIWTTNQGKESIREVYQKLESGRWNKFMIGYGDQIFYEKLAGEK